MGRISQQMVRSARQGALRLVLGVTEAPDGQGRSIADQIASGLLAPLSPPDRARAQRLALATLRNVARAEHVLRPRLRKPPPPVIRALLRLSVVEMLAEGAPSHAVVNDAVALTREMGAAGMAGMVNAVLRAAAATPQADWDALPPQPLPNWLRGRLMSAYGKKAVQAIEAAHARGADLDLTPRDGDATTLAATLGAEALPTGSVRIRGAAQVSQLPGYEQGGWWVQDAAAAIPARVLAARPGERVLDLCAAPGGKTLQLAATGASVTALDISDQRMDRLRQNLTRCGLSAECVVADALDWQPDQPFDAVLLDAPCSATGTIRRHPDLPFIRDGKSIAQIADLQDRLIDRALGFLRPGGRLVFATCSLLPEEGESRLAAALERHPGLRANREALDLPGIAPQWITADGGLRLRPDYWPERGGMDGFFVARLDLPGA
ncbi:16S rRNA (cytosine967-C5)-methyltransferase [Albidovulum inexpectatum]|uniref:16S rRNA (Cytosine967-C5)-methyltransferase n=1 Tax=Albidovulum inexpectatum TaxID=196587 RepID=A0A2S5JMV5_9RHOB|nr:RsmB/NOP family class I SAM-dependent RNA methyltransferase [Albidovulum inexpectatum]PPB82575.1 16S rRNA (cytosine967-C5)-methyltransferase [Albidovulum inexpectatum]